MPNGTKERQGKGTATIRHTPKQLNQQETVQLLIDSGILFELNRTKLHPYGMALVAQVVNGKYELGMLTNNPGVVFDREVFKRGMTKMDKWLKTIGNGLLQARQKAVGFTAQVKEDWEEQRRRPDR
jgi:hypothetical protein